MNQQNSDCLAAHNWLGQPIEETPNRALTVIDLIESQASNRPSSPFLSLPRGSGVEYDVVSFAELRRMTEAGAAWLKERADIKSGEVVAVAPRNELRSVALIFSLLWLGASIAVVDPNAPQARKKRMVEALKLRTMDAAVDVEEVDARVFAFPSPDQLPDARQAPNRVDPQQDVFYIGTSGSTSVSKIVAQTHANLIANAWAVTKHHGLAPGIRFLGCLPIHHVNGLHLSVMAALFAGSHTLLLPGFDLFRYPQHLAAFAPHIASVVPSILQALISAGRPAQMPDGFRYFVSAAAPLSRSLAALVWDRWTARVNQGYGLTETVNFSTTLPADLSESAYRRLMIDAEIPTIGCAVPGNEVAVLDRAGSPVAQGVVGEICVRGHNVMSRYVNNDGETFQAFRFGWFHTGDLGYFKTDPDSEQQFIVISGREKNVAKVRGESVSLEEMERCLLELPGIQDAACSAVPDAITGEAIVAAFRGEPILQTDAIYAHLAKYFQKAALPRTVVRMDNIPRTPTGKLLRPELKALLDDLG